MMDDADTVSISALQHWSYCPRQCGLIHVEQAFAENVHTLRGQATHARADEPGCETRAGLRVERAMPLASEMLGLLGKADVVEFLPDGTPYPVEYKHGRHTKALRGHDRLQLAAQALCLEEMTGRNVPEGALFYASSHRRVTVSIDAALRASVEQAIEAVRTMIRAGRLPAPVNDERCTHCSLIDICQPALLQDATALARLRIDLFDPDS